MGVIAPNFKTCFIYHTFVHDDEDDDNPCDE